MKVKNWTHLYPKYAGLWITFKDDETTIASSAKSLKSAINKAEKLGVENPLAYKVPQKPSFYVG